MIQVLSFIVMKTATKMKIILWAVAVVMMAIYYSPAEDAASEGNGGDNNGGYLGQWLPGHPLPNAAKIIRIYTADKDSAGTTAKVHVVLHGENGERSDVLSYTPVLGMYFSRGAVNEFGVTALHLGSITEQTTLSHVEVWIKPVFVTDNDWFVDRIVVENQDGSSGRVFPIQRWIKSDGVHYLSSHLDTALPQNERFPDQRKAELALKYNEYQYVDRGGFVLLDQLPDDEKFPAEHRKYFDDSVAKSKWDAFMYPKRWFWKEWKSVMELAEMWNAFGYRPPKHVDDWDDDVNFGRQRLEATNTNLISLVTSLPDKFPVTDTLVASLLEGMTLAEAIQQKRILITDLHIMDGVPTRDSDTVMCSPMALFFNDKTDQLRPIAIQLFQVPGKGNPIFTPNDPVKTWTFVKMWYNNADVAYQTGIVHIGKTHFLLEGVIASAHRHVSQSHPVFKILAPHFLYTMQVSKIADETLLKPGSGFDNIASSGLVGAMELIRKAFSDMKMNVITYYPDDLRDRGVDDLSVLPNYHSRNDALLLHAAIEKYVNSYVDLYYMDEELLVGDEEIQNWVKELAASIDDGGVGVNELPGQGQMTNTADLKKLLTSIIYTCSVGHAITNSPQYDTYAFIPNYPGLLLGQPPTSLIDDVITDQHILASLPVINSALEQVTLTWRISLKDTNSLGDFEVDYIYDPPAVEVLQQFRDDLKAASEEIKERNLHRESPYLTLLPENVPNSMSA